MPPKGSILQNLKFMEKRPLPFDPSTYDYRKKVWFKVRSNKLILIWKRKYQFCFILPVQVLNLLSWI